MWKDRLDKWLLGAAVLALMLIVLINLRLDLWPVLEGGWVAEFLRADATASVSSDLLIGLISAYIFYVAIDLYPRSKREKEIKAALNMLLNSIILSYKSPDVLRRPRMMRNVEKTIDSIGAVATAIKTLDEDRGSYTNLKFMAEEANKRLPDLLSNYVLASSLSHEAGILWMEITDATRLLSDCHEFLADANKPTLEIITSKEKFHEFRRQQADFYTDKKEGVRITMQHRGKVWFDLVQQWSAEV